MSDSQKYLHIVEPKTFGTADSSFDDVQDAILISVDDGGILFSTGSELYDEAYLPVGGGILSGVPGIDSLLCQNVGPGIGTVLGPDDGWDSGIDTIMDFALGEDKLRFDDLFGGQQPDQDALALLLESGVLALEYSRASESLLLTVNDGAQQESIIDIRFSQGFTDVHAQQAGGSVADQAELLYMLI